jgi:hypothetical protein
MRAFAARVMGIRALELTFRQIIWKVQCLPESRIKALVGVCRSGPFLFLRAENGRRRISESAAADSQQSLKQPILFSGPGSRVLAGAPTLRLQGVYRHARASDVRKLAQTGKSNGLGNRRSRVRLPHFLQPPDKRKWVGKDYKSFYLR